jgi:hypothetical protein
MSSSSRIDGHNASGSTPQSSKLANLLMGLKESEDDFVNGNTPEAPMPIGMIPLKAQEELIEACNCRKSRCLKLYVHDFKFLAVMIIIL